MNLTDIGVDTSITNFKFAINLDGLYTYLPNGIEDYEKGENTSSFAIMIKDTIDIDQANSLLDYMVKSLKDNKDYMYSEVGDKNSIHDNRLYREVSLEEKSLSSNNKIIGKYYYAFAFKENHAIIFLSVDFDNATNFQKFIQTFWKLKI